MRIRTDILRISPVDIASAVGLPVTRLFEIAGNIEKFYKPTRLHRTPSGKWRELDVPKPFLRDVLRKVHRFLQRRNLYSPAAHGGIKNRSSFTSAKNHLGQQAVAIRDVCDCYPSVTSERLLFKLRQLGFRSDTSRLLTGLLTCHGRIPQGACTSGDALNLFLWILDLDVLEYYGSHVQYSRMADDHVISGMNEEQVSEAAAFLEDRLAVYGLSVNEKKKARNGLIIAPQKQCVHSIGVNHRNKTRIPRDRCNEYVAYGLKYIRAAQCVSRDSFLAVVQIRRKLDGYINYSSQADISAADHLQRLASAGDAKVQKRLAKAGVSRSKNWWRDRFTDEVLKRWLKKVRIVNPRHQIDQPPRISTEIPSVA